MSFVVPKDFIEEIPRRGKMKKSKRVFGILSGKILLPFTIRSERRIAIDHFLEDRGFPGMKGWATPKNLEKTIPGHKVIPVDAVYEVKA